MVDYGFRFRMKCSLMSRPIDVSKSSLVLAYLWEMCVFVVFASFRL